VILTTGQGSDLDWSVMDVYHTMIHCRDLEEIGKKTGTTPMKLSTRNSSSNWSKFSVLSFVARRKIYTSPTLHDEFTQNQHVFDTDS
jgi:hypothetical protein